MFLKVFLVNLFISIQKNKSKSAYDALTSEYEKSQLKLQDTRTHSWSGAEKKK